MKFITRIQNFFKSNKRFEVEKKIEVIEKYKGFVKAQHREVVEMKVNRKGKIEIELCELEKIIRVKDKDFIHRNL